MKGGESGATGPTWVAEGVGWCNVRIGLSFPFKELEDSGFERGEGVRGGFDMDGRGWKKLGCVVKVGRSLDKRRPRAAAVEEEAADVGIGIYNSGGSRDAIFDLSSCLSRSRRSIQRLWR